MMKDEHDRAFEAWLRATLRDEAGALWPSPALWPRVQAALTQPAAAAPDVARPRAELRVLLRRGDWRRLTIALLAERELDAFGLARRVEDIARRTGTPTPPDGVLLPVLHRLEVEGVVTARWRPGPQGPRRAYALSARGRRVWRRARLTWRVTGLGARLGRLIAPRVPVRGDGAR